MNITVYSKPDCVQCDMTKRYLDRHSVSYEVVDVTQDEDALEYVKSLGFASVPVVKAGNNVWAGFRVERLEELVLEKELM